MRKYEKLALHICTYLKCFLINFIRIYHLITLFYPIFTITYNYLLNYLFIH